MSGGPYGPGGVLSDFWGGGEGGGSPRCIIGQTHFFVFGQSLFSFVFLIMIMMMMMMIMPTDLKWSVLLQI